MTMYPRSLDDRFSGKLADMLRRITKLETRTAAIDSGYPLACLPAVINPGYTSGNPTAYINGATTLTGPYAYLTPYTPTASDAVYVMPVGAQQTYIILGKVA
jgi:hypothetical protein